MDADIDSCSNSERWGEAGESEAREAWGSCPTFAGKEESGRVAED